MKTLSSPAIILKRIEYRDSDLIITFFTLNYGKITAIAKYAKKSKKRFASVLEPFGELNIVISYSRDKELLILTEAQLFHSFIDIKKNILKTAYASYWSEIINKSVENFVIQKHLYILFYNLLNMIDKNIISETTANIIFQIRFANISGIKPELRKCYSCKRELNHIKGEKLFFDIEKGSIICKDCNSGKTKKILLFKGTIKQLLWVQDENIERALKIKFTKYCLEQGTYFMEHFITYYIGNNFKSLKFLKEIE